jgi:hypothetical protein
VLVIEELDGELVIEDRLGFLERDLVLAQIARTLRRIPLEPNTYIVLMKRRQSMTDQPSKFGVAAARFIAARDGGQVGSSSCVRLET